MTEYENVLNIFKSEFNNLNGVPDSAEFNDRLYIEIQNNQNLLNKARSKSIVFIWQAITTVSQNLINCILDYNELPTGASNEQIKKACKEVFNADFYELTQPTFNYYYRGID